MRGAFGTGRVAGARGRGGATPEPEAASLISFKAFRRGGILRGVTETRKGKIDTER